MARTPYPHVDSDSRAFTHEKSDATRRGFCPLLACAVRRMFHVSHNPKASTQDAQSASHADFKLLDAARIFGIAFRRSLQRIFKPALLAVDPFKPWLVHQHVALSAARLVFSHLIPEQAAMGRLHGLARPLVVVDEEIVCLDDGRGEYQAIMRNIVSNVSRSRGRSRRQLTPPAGMPCRNQA